MSNNEVSTQLLLVNKKGVKDREIFINSCRSNVRSILLDENTDILAEIQQLKEQHGDTSYENIGIVQHSNPSINIGNLKLSIVILDKDDNILTEENINDQELFFKKPEDIENNELVNVLKTIVATYSVKNIDLISCSMVEMWDETITELETILNVNIRASLDNTGNLKYGGNWVQESDDINIKYIYFTDEIENYEYLLGNWYNEFSLQRPHDAANYQQGGGSGSNLRWTTSTVLGRPADAYYTPGEWAGTTTIDHWSKPKHTWSGYTGRPGGFATGYVQVGPTVSSHNQPIITGTASRYSGEIKESIGSNFYRAPLVVDINNKLMFYFKTHFVGTSHPSAAPTLIEIDKITVKKYNKGAGVLWGWLDTSVDTEIVPSTTEYSKTNSTESYVQREVEILDDINGTGYGPGRYIITCNYTRRYTADYDVYKKYTRWHRQKYSGRMVRNAKAWTYFYGVKGAEGGTSVSIQDDSCTTDRDCRTNSHKFSKYVHDGLNRTFGALPSAVKNGEINWRKSSTVEEDKEEELTTSTYEIVIKSTTPPRPTVTKSSSTLTFSRTGVQGVQYEFELDKYSFTKSGRFDTRTRYNYMQIGTGYSGTYSSGNGAYTYKSAGDIGDTPEEAAIWAASQTNLSGYFFRMVLWDTDTSTAGNFSGSWYFYKIKYKVNNFTSTPVALTHNYATKLVDNKNFFFRLYKLKTQTTDTYDLSAVTTNGYNDDGTAKSFTYPSGYYTLKIRDNGYLGEVEEDAVSITSDYTYLRFAYNKDFGNSSPDPIVSDSGGNVVAHSTTPPTNTIINGDDISAINLVGDITDTREVNLNATITENIIITDTGTLTIPAGYTYSILAKALLVNCGILNIKGTLKVHSKGIFITSSTGVLNMIGDGKIEKIET